MTAQTFFKRLRKTTILLLLIVLVFLTHRIINFFTVEESGEHVEIIDELEKSESVICHNIVSGKAFGVDSVFEEKTRLYFYTSVHYPDSASLYHKWFRGIDTVMVSRCTRIGSLCFTSLSPDHLHAGEWSVDLVYGNKVLDSKQFIVESKEY